MVAHIGLLVALYNELEFLSWVLSTDAHPLRAQRLGATPCYPPWDWEETEPKQNEARATWECEHLCL